MKQSRLKTALAILGLAAAMGTSSAMAQDQGWYAGLTFGNSKFKDACEGVADCDDKDTAWRILGGYQFNKNLAVELGYTDLGEASAPGASVEATAFEVVAVGSWPFTPQFSAYGKVGLYRGETDATAPGVSASESNTDLTYGIGVRWDFSKNLGLRAEYQLYKDLGGDTIGESDADVISIGVIWKF